MPATVSNVGKQSQLKKAEAFRCLHIPGNPLVLYNVWDAGSAQAVANAGAKAIATSSWAVAKAHGFEDGERIPFELAIQNLRRIVGAVDLPVTVDLERGYGDGPEKVAKSISIAIEAGAIGCNLEDTVPVTLEVRDTETQVNRIHSARKTADSTGIPFFINARCDLFFYGGDSVPHDDELLAKVVDRAHAYAQAGANGLFVPGLATISLISQLAKKSPIPLNILVDSRASVQILADNGVSRISYGATPYVEMFSGLEKASRASYG
jgi:2-methylisocitrate lyase-like PEP mutase family enzyme